MKLLNLSLLIPVLLLACDNRPQPQQVYVQQPDPQVQIILVPGHPLFSDPYYHSYGYYHSSYYHQPVVHQTTVINHTTVVHQTAPAPVVHQTTVIHQAAPVVQRPTAPPAPRYMPPRPSSSFSGAKRR